VAVLAMALGAGAKLAEAARLANMAASVAVTRIGPAPVTEDELKKVALSL
jgi:D-beta-D-heptose 7-phosphate kinase/D-beta-D-heptose 1-phosphate adenosyltransferase